VTALRRSACRLAFTVAAVVPGRLAAQASDALYARFNALSGWEYRAYHFDPGLSVRTVSQWNVPLVLVAPLGRRMSLDLTSHLASGTVRTYADSTGGETLTGLTDTQLRLLYTLQRDRLVASLSLNLPTGKHSVSTSAFQVSGAVGSNYLSFPVYSFGTAFGVTGGLAYAQQAGRWNLGFSGSVRYLGSYEPFNDQPISYAPGVEMRVRAGADRLLGASGRMLLGLTTSTFSTDEFTGTGTITSGTYKPGVRFIGDAAFLRVFGRTTVTLALWDFYRTAGDTNNASNPESKENVLNVELRLARPLGAAGGGRVQLEPMLGFRQWSPADYRGGRLYSTGLTARIGLNDRLTTNVSGRFDTGWIYAQGRGRADLTGTGFSLWLRYQR
jgi:hypothetical protein